MDGATTAIILLNWNGAEDTIACLHSLLHMACQDFCVVVCDNDSADGSFAKLQAWGRDNLGERCVTWSLGQTPAPGAKVILIQTGANLGFAGGCNVGLRYAVLHTPAHYLWLLNNDTVVDPSALTLLVQKLQSRPDVGICGATIAYFDDPAVLQAPGGYDFNFWTARVLVPFANASPANLPTEADVERRLQYISGASMFVRREFVTGVGLLNEQYFLYFEEVDWATRGRPQWTLGYCAASRILHKEGRSIGSHRNAQQRSSFSERYLSRNRILFLRTYFPRRLPVCLAWVTMVYCIRFLKGNRTGANDLWHGVRDGLRAPIAPIPAMDDWPTSMQHP